MRVPARSAHDPRTDRVVRSQTEETGNDMHTRNTRRAQRWTGAAATAAALLATASSADAARLEGGTFHDAGSEVVDWCPGINLEYSWEVSGSFVGVERGPNGFPHYRDHSKGIDRYTNLDTGKSFWAEYTVNSNDLSVVDNGDGTATIVTQGAGGARFFDGDGNFVLANPGMSRWEILIDHGGTIDPSDDQFISLEVVKGSTGRNDLEGRDFCADVIEFTA